MIQIVDPPDGAVLQDQCIIDVTSEVYFEEYEAQFETNEFDFLFVLDRSGSMLQNDPQDYTKIAAIHLLDVIPQDKSVNCGVIIFGGGQVIQPMTTNRSEVRNTLYNMGARTLGTDIAGALLTAHDELEANSRPLTAKFLILLSDGWSNSDEALAAADLIGETIHTFHLGDPADDGAILLQEIADRTGGNYTQVDNPNSLPDLFEKAIITYTARVTDVGVVSGFEPDRVVYATEEQDDLWVARGLLVDGPTTLTAFAVTNEIPPRYGLDTNSLEARTGGLTDPFLSIDSPTEMQVLDQNFTLVEGRTDVFVKPGIPNPEYDPCILTRIESVETSTTAAPKLVFKTTPVDGVWSQPDVPIRRGPGQITLIYSTATTTDYPKKRLTVVRKVVHSTPCRPIADIVDRLDEPDWEGYNQIWPFDPFTLTDTAAGLNYSLPGAVQGGYFGFYQVRDALCAAPAGVNMIRVFLGGQRSETSLLPDCRVRVFRNDNSRSFYCRVNELNGRSLPAYLDVPYYSDGESDIRVAVDLLGFDRRQAGGWTLLDPMSPRSSWTFPIHTSVGTAAAATYVGEIGSDASGSCLARAGDVNGDGYDDFLIGARDNPKAGKGAGKIYLVLGEPGNWHRWTDLWFSTPSFLGEAVEDFAGTGLAGVGDVNGDGYDDFLIGAPGNDEGGLDAGKVYLFLGRPDGWGFERPLTDADATFLGESPGDQLGMSLAPAGDVNHDSYGDFLLGVPRHSTSHYSDGKVYLFLGNPIAWGHGTPVTAGAGSYVGEETYDFAGISLAPAGDVNGDTYDDFLVGAKGSDSGAVDAGQTYLIFGKQRGWVREYPLGSSVASYVGEAQGDHSGAALAGAGDVNGDGYDDFLIGSPDSDYTDLDAGQAYLMLGKASGWAPRVSLSGADAKFYGEALGDQAGCAVGGAGDVNGDGFDDLLIGAIHASQGPWDSGSVYLYPGALDGWQGDIPLSASRYSFSGESSMDLLGFQVGGVGDVNGDGFDDFVAGAPGNADGGTEAGHSYLLLGSASGPRFVAGPPTQPSSVAPLVVPVEQALSDLSESTWEPYRQILPFQPVVLADTAEGLEFRLAAPFSAGFFAFYQTRESFQPLSAGLHFLRLTLRQDRAIGTLLPDCRVRVFTQDNTISYSALYTEAAGGTLPTVLDVPFVSDGVWPFRVAIDLMCFDQRMFGGWTVTGIEVDPQAEFQGLEGNGIMAGLLLENK